MILRTTLAATVVGLLFSSFSFGQDTTPKPALEMQKHSATDVQVVEVKKDEKTKTLFTSVKNPLNKINYLGLSVGSEISYGTLAGQFTPMAGFSGMLHLNKKWGIGVAGYTTIDNGFAPTAINASGALNLNSMYGGLKFEYTPNPNAAVHVSFPLLIGYGSARVDSVKSQDVVDGNDALDGHNGNEANYGNEQNGKNSNNFFVIQPGINVETNLFRFAKIYAGASYRLVPSVTNESSTTASTFPIPTAGQLSGFNLSLGVKIGLFDYSLHKRKNKQNNAIIKQ